MTYKLPETRCGRAGAPSVLDTSVDVDDPRAANRRMPVPVRRLGRACGVQWLCFAKALLVVLVGHCNGAVHGLRLR